MTVRRPRTVVAAAALLAAVSTGCAASEPEGSPADSPTPASTPAPDTAREARVGPTQRLTFVPTRLTLDRVAAATTVERVDTLPSGVLGLPENSDHVGWWESGALAGEIYGTVVIAGHVDSATQGLGFFAHLLAIEVGQEVTLSGSGARQRYRVRAVHDVPKAELAVNADTFAADVRGRLLMVTCSGAFDRRTDSYAQNRLVYADPIGTAERAAG
jgi:hypothetical protein